MLNPANLRPGCEQHETWTPQGHAKSRVQYDYRADNGDLFSTVAKDLAQARAQRDAWIQRRIEARAAAIERAQAFPMPRARMCDNCGHPLPIGSESDYCTLACEREDRRYREREAEMDRMIDQDH